MIYRLYSWRLKEKDDTPGTTVELLMCLPHLFQIATIYAILLYSFPSLKNDNLTRFQLIFFIIGFQFLYHFLVYNKKRWMCYIEEFKNETFDQRKKGTNLIILYTLSTYILFFGCLIVLFW